MAKEQKSDIPVPQRTTVSTEPTKKFFVQMLTRDIALEDAILDLLDNCIDGVLRTHDISDFDQPYRGFWAKLSLDENHFEIEDNCGGIPASLRDRAFRLGRSDSPDESAVVDPENSVGVYGIGMKRAIFKMGGDALILTQNGDDRYQVMISSDWLTSEGWDLEVEDAPNRFPQDGTTISVEGLYPEISDRFASESFQDELLEKIRSHYSIIIGKGFQVSVNSHIADPKPPIFKFSDVSSKDTIRPYMFRSKLDDVNVFLAVGFRAAIPSADELDEEQDQIQMSTKDAGWTVICNDRVVVSNNKDELTGWGTANIPHYHNQFRAIIGVVEFRGNAAKLPTTTTKRGLNFQSSLYQQVLNRMREGIRVFIDYTNDWKSREEEAKSQVAPVRTIGFPTLKAQADSVGFNQVRSGMEGERFKPALPKPPTNSPDVRISYFREREDVESLAEEILPEYRSLQDKEIRKKVGEMSFDLIFQERLGRNPGD